MNIRIPKELIDYLDAVRGDKSRQAYLVNMLELEYKDYAKDNILENLLKTRSISGGK